MTPGRSSRPGPRADMVGLVHQVDPAALVRRQPRLSPVAALQAEAQTAFGEVAAEQLRTARRGAAGCGAAGRDAVQRGPQDLGRDELHLPGGPLEAGEPAAGPPPVIAR